MQKPSTPQELNGKFEGKDILSADQFSKKDIDIVLSIVDDMKKIVIDKGATNLLYGKIMAAIFYEPSSRTFSSFVASMQRLGGGFIPLQGMGNSSAAKGETLHDTIKTFSSYSDIIVMRHPEVGSTKLAADATDIPVINAGDGIGEHPTQALLDLYTIAEEFGEIENLTITFFGELAHYRSINSVTRLLSHYPNIKMDFVSPKEVDLIDDTRTFLKKKGIGILETENIQDVISTTDVLYVTRVKKEFLPPVLYKKIEGKYIVDAKLVSKMKKKSIIMHNLPRIGEITTDVDKDPRAVYLRNQMRNGMYVRMALLALVLGKA